MDSEFLVTKVLEKHGERLKGVLAVKKRRDAFNSYLTIAKERKFFLGITGIRGIGKTILLLQMVQELGGVYLSADDRELRGVDLYDIIAALAASGHTSIYIDEIHAKPNWDSDLKAIYDENIAYVVFTGSSAISLKDLKADLSRRVVLEELPPASFREWLVLKRGETIPSITLEKILAQKNELVEKLGLFNPLISEYYRSGGVLYDYATGFYKTIISTLETIALKDLAILKEMDPEREELFFKILYFIAKAGPMDVSFAKIGSAIQRDRVWVMRFLQHMEKTGVIKRVYACGTANAMRKDAKYYLPFPYRHALCSAVNVLPNLGVLREEFFVNHTTCCYIQTGRKATADFKIGEKSYEIGGASKGQKQKADIRVVDGLVTADNRVPLLLFGFLY